MNSLCYSATLLVALALLAGCASVPRTAPDLAGRLALRVDAYQGAAARSVSVQFELRGDAQAGELQLTTPLGSVAAQARWQAGSAELITPDGSRRFADLDSLAAELLGQTLPLAAMIDWLRGRPWPGAPSALREGGFDQLGWQVDLSRLADGWVAATRDSPPALSVRVRLELPA